LCGSSTAPEETDAASSLRVEVFYYYYYEFALLDAALFLAFVSFGFADRYFYTLSIISSVDLGQIIFLYRWSTN
jgi:hypothetical protein